MFKDITLGQYYAASSPIHRADPRVKLLSLIVFLATVLLCSSFYSYLLVFVSVFVIIAASQIPFKVILKNLKSLILKEVVINYGKNQERV